MTYHNAENYARGLLDELEGAERLERAEVAADVRAELAAVSGVLEAVNPDVLSADARDRWADVRTRMAAALRAEAAEEGADGGGQPVKAAGSRRVPRNTAAAQAPERAVPPTA